MKSTTYVQEVSNLWDEQLFSRLVLQAFGQLPHQQDLPDSPRVFATVVFLRELLQHLGFAHIRVETQEVA